MKLRALKKEDAPGMLEWMHDPDVVKNMQTNFAAKTMDDCLRFIEASRTDSGNLHLAVADDRDEYLGTVSLKYLHGGRAEFAITMRRRAMGTGAAREAMAQMLEKGLKEMGLRSVYWCVSPDNARAVRFYDKNGYPRAAAPAEAAGYSPEQISRYIWYQVSADPGNPTHRI